MQGQKGKMRRREEPNKLNAYVGREEERKRKKRRRRKVKG